MRIKSKLYLEKVREHAVRTVTELIDQKNRVDRVRVARRRSHQGSVPRPCQI